jgi:hypothetical protein
MAYTHAMAEKAKAPKPEIIGIPGSSFLQSATYDPSTYSLTIDFKTGSQIVHRYVYPMVWQQFKETPSKGSFYARQLKGKYQGIEFKPQLKVSDLDRAIKQHRGKRANQHNAATIKKNNRRQPT